MLPLKGKIILNFDIERHFLVEGSALSFIVYTRIAITFIQVKTVRRFFNETEASLSYI